MLVRSVPRNYCASATPSRWWMIYLPVSVMRWYASAYRWSVFAFRYFSAAGATSELGERHEPETHLIPILLEVAAGQRECFEIYGDDYATPDGTCVRDFVHVLDIANAHIL